MILTRLGNKSKLSSTLHHYFPPHKMRIDLFFGAGGAFFNLPRPKYSVLNDLDDDVSNLYLVVLHDRERLKEELRRMPISQGLLRYWKQHVEREPIKKAIRFLLISNFTYLGKGDTLRVSIDNSKMNLIDRIDSTFDQLKYSKITNLDFRDVLGTISFSKKLIAQTDAFIYMDPVYLDTDHYYKVPKWTIDDTIDCFEIMANSGIRSALSEFDHPEILKLVDRYGFHKIQLGVRQNIKNRRSELLITNYQPVQQLDMYHAHQQCLSDGCTEPSYEFGYCFKHYMEEQEL